MVSEDTMRYWIAEVCKMRRERAGITQHEVAARMNRASTAVSRFENHRHLGVLDPLVEAYSYCLKVPALELFEEACRAWRAATEPHPASPAAP